MDLFFLQLPDLVVKEAYYFPCYILASIDMFKGGFFLHNLILISATIISNSLLLKIAILSLLHFNIRGQYLLKAH